MSVLFAWPIFERSASLHKPASFPRLPGAERMRVLHCGWSRSNAWRQRSRVNRRAQARPLSKQRRLHQLAARHGAIPTPCSWVFGARWVPALICDAPNLHYLERFPCSIDLQIRTVTSMLHPMPTPSKPHPYKAQSSIPNPTAQNDPLQSALHRSFLVAADSAARGNFNVSVVRMNV